MVNKIALAIDSSTRAIGVCAMDMDDHSILWSKSYVRGNVSTVVFLQNSFTSLEYQLKSRIGQPSYWVIEEPMTMNNPTTLKRLSEVIGAIKQMVFGSFGGRFNMYKPTEWRKIIGLQGRKREELKKASIAYVMEHYNVEADDDEADAICMASALCIENDRREL